MIYEHLSPHWIFVNDVFELIKIKTLAVIILRIEMKSLISFFFHFEYELTQFIHLIFNILMNNTSQLFSLYCKLDLIMYIFKAFTHSFSAL